MIYFGRICREADSFISSTIWGYKAVGGVGEYDPEKAAECLKEAGYENGEGLPELNIYTSVGFYPRQRNITSTLQLVYRLSVSTVRSFHLILHHGAMCYMKKLLAT